MSLFIPSLTPALDSSGNPISAARWYFYLSGTTTPTSAYSDDTLSTSIGSYVESDAAGRFDPVYLDDTISIRAILKDSLGATISPFDLDPANATTTSYGVFSVRAYGAKGDNSHDDTAAIQAAIDAASGGGVVLFPGTSVGYKVTDTITITDPSVTLQGVGDDSLILPSGDYGDVFHAYPGSGPNLQGFRMKDLHVYTGTDTTSGAVAHLEDCNNFRIDGCRFTGRFGGIFLDGSVHGYIDADLQSDGAFAAFRSNSYLLRCDKSAAGTIPAEIHVDKADWRGATGNNYLHYAVLLNCTDGIWFDTPHFGFCRVAMGLIPATNTSHMTSVIVDSGYMDTVSENFLAVVEPSSSYSADFGLHQFDFSTCYNSGNDGILWNCKSTGTNFWSSISVTSMFQVGFNGINFTQATRVFVRDGWSIINPSYVSASKNGILIDGTSEKITVGEGVVEDISGGNVPAAAVALTTNVDGIRVGVIRNLGCTASIADTSVTANKSLATPLTW